MRKKGGLPAHNALSGLFLRISAPKDANKSQKMKSIISQIQTWQSSGICRKKTAGLKTRFILF